MERTVREPIIDYRLPTTDYGLQTTDSAKQLTESNSANAINSQQSASVQSQSQSLYIYPVQLIRKDLTKTLVLCILAISLEIGLYFFLEKPGLLPF